jgi:arylsulfatase A-like enzyme
MIRLTALLSVGIIALATPLLSGTAGTRPPNIVFILADDQRYDELGGTGDPVVRTPHIDALARDGALFLNSFCPSPSCLPNRTSLLTGQWERRHAVGWNSASALSREQWQHTLPQLLKRAGYAIGYVGKNHTPGLRQWDYDYYYGSFDDHLGFYPKAKHPIFQNARADTQIEILAEGAAHFLKPDPAFLAKAQPVDRVALIPRNPDQPFFLNICFNVPHGSSTRGMERRDSDDALYRDAYRDGINLIPPPAGYLAAADVASPKIPVDIYNGKQISQYDYRLTLDTLREQRVRISQTAEGIDRVVGQLRAIVAELGQAENTIFVYTSDNGLLHGEFGYGGKALLYDPSIRVPLILFDPRLPDAQRGRRVPELVVSPDVAPTLLELAGLAASSAMEGRSLLPLLHAERTDWREDFLCENLLLLQNYPQIQAVRTRSWKYIRYWPMAPLPADYRDVLNVGRTESIPPYEELFQLDQDPLEQRNLASEPAHRERLLALRARCSELVRAHRPDPDTVPTIPVKDWIAEIPAEWAPVIPRLSVPRQR